MSVVELFSLSDVRLGSGPFARAQELAAGYILALDPERLLAPFYREAGLPETAPRYPGWESGGMDGHTAGHYLSAAAAMYAATGRPEFLARAQRMTAGLRRAQQAIGTGYVGGIPNASALWSELAAGAIDETTFSRDGRWVPLYNLHKTFAGALDAAELAGIEEAREIVVGLAEWWLALAAHIDDAQFEVMLATEYGGMNDAFARLGAITGREDMLAMARRFAHRAVYEPLVRGEDHLTGLHANTQIPKVIGYARLGAVAGDADAARAAGTFWDAVRSRRSVSIGGNSVGEHFHAPQDFGPMVERREGPETCNSHNMIRLGSELFCADADPARIDVIERILFNHILSAQHPEHGGFVYFSPMRPGHYRVYSTPDSCFWCCVGTGMEAHARHGAAIYAHGPDTLWVNLFIDSTVRWRERGVSVRQRTDFPFAPSTTLTVTVTDPSPRWAMRIRVPGWSAEPPRVTINGRLERARVDAGYLHLERTWHSDDEVSVEWRMETVFDELPDGSAWAAVRHGPIVLAAAAGHGPLTGLRADAARLSHIALGPLSPLAQTAIVSDIDPAQVRALDRGRLRFGLQTSVGEVELMPFFALHDRRYVVYWPTGADSADRTAQLDAIDARELAVDGRTIDAVALGEQQPEVDHAFVGASAEAGHEGVMSWRRTSERMSVTLDDWPRLGRTLRLTRLVRGPAAYDVLVNGATVLRVERDGDGDGAAEDVDVAVARDDAAAGTRVCVEIVAHPGRRSDPISRLRLLQAPTMAPAA